MEKEILELILVEVKESKQKLTNLENDMQDVKTRLTCLENDMQDVKTRLTCLENDMYDVKRRLNILEEKVDSNSKDIKDIKEIVCEHYDEFIRFKKHNSVQHNLYDARLLKIEEECEEYFI